MTVEILNDTFSALYYDGNTETKVAIEGNRIFANFRLSKSQNTLTVTRNDVPRYILTTGSNPSIKYISHAFQTVVEKNRCLFYKNDRFLFEAKCGTSPANVPISTSFKIPHIQRYLKDPPEVIIPPSSEQSEVISNYLTEMTRNLMEEQSKTRSPKRAKTLPVIESDDGAETIQVMDGEVGFKRPLV
jgi:hypothetical protein